MSQKIFCDIDGVVANFEEAALTTLEQRYPNVKLPETGYWRERYDHWGPYNEAQIAQFWSITRLPSWWLRVLPILPAAPALGNWMRFSHGALFDIYFVTSRRGPLVAHQTREWLDHFGLLGVNSSMIQVDRRESKSKLALELLPDYVIEDDARTLSLIHSDFKSERTLPRPTLYLIAAPYNRLDYEEIVQDQGEIMKPVEMLETALTEISERCITMNQTASKQ